MKPYMILVIIGSVNGLWNIWSRIFYLDEYERTFNTTNQHT